MAKYTYQDSPFGPIVHPHFNHADDKFNKENPPFHGDLALEGDEADTYKALVDKKSKEAFEDYMANGDGSKLTPGAQKKWSVYVPYEEEEDRDGNPTGRTLFSFKQNSRIRTAEGVKIIQIGIYDAEGTEIADMVTHGSIVRVRHSFRPIVLKTNQQVGVRMDFSMVQVKELAAGSAGGHGFGSVEGGFKGTKGKASEAPNPDASDDSGESDY